MFCTDKLWTWWLFWCNYHWMAGLKCLDNLIFHFLLIFQIDVFSNIPRQISKCINGMPHVHYFISAVYLCIGFLQYQSSDVITDWLAIAMIEWVQYFYFYQFPTLEHIDGEVLWLLCVLFIIGNDSLF